MAVPRTYKTKTEQDVLTDIQAQRATPMTLRQIAATYGQLITHGDIARILHGIFPKGTAKRYALHLAPVCPACTQRLPRQPRPLPAWLLEAVQNLVELEKKASHPTRARVYARGGKRVRMPVRETSIYDQRRIKNDTIATTAIIPSPR